ncbi:MAG: type II toxin-antitoxin system RelE/ParE family toxin [Nanoarchaeota archaeon]|nr:type II toxin-antitoxin system RelE/ParE family toxin [Nanoarchaeota archaeon]MBU1946284.1 type II toxin-antitoxin system RelE/ParE family toxin [Nanoarchaeota archaeon]
MLNIDYNDDFLKIISKIKNLDIKAKIKKHIEKIIENPEIGKPMGYGRKGTREVYVSPYRLAYSYNLSDNKIIFLDVYHKDEQ